MSTVRDELVKVRALVAAGWTKGSYKLDGCYCLAGAVYQVDYGQCRGVYAKLLDALTAQLPSPPPIARPGSDSTIVDWNDRPGTTQADVLALIDRAIAAEEAA